MAIASSADRSRSRFVSVNAPNPSAGMTDSGATHAATRTHTRRSHVRQRNGRRVETALRNPSYHRMRER